MEAGLIAASDFESTLEGDKTRPPAPVFKFPLIELGKSFKTSKTSEERSQTGQVGPVLLFAIIACVGGVLGGYSHGFPSPTLYELEIAYQSGERVTAFSSSSIYEGLFGVSYIVAEPVSPTPLLYMCTLSAGHWSHWWTVWGLNCRSCVRSLWSFSCSRTDERPSPDWLAYPDLRSTNAYL